MKKALTIIAVAVMLITVFAFVLFAIDTCGSDPEAGSKGDGLVLYVVICLLGFILISENAFFSGVGMILLKNRTPLKIILGIVIVIISAVCLICMYDLFFERCLSNLWFHITGRLHGS